jgi:hypothetical protein
MDSPSNVDLPISPEKITLKAISQHLLRTFVLELYVDGDTFQQKKSTSANGEKSYVEFAIKDIFGYSVSFIYPSEIFILSQNVLGIISNNVPGEQSQGTVKYVFDEATSQRRENVWFQKIRATIQPNEWYLFTKVAVSRDTATKTLTLSYDVKEDEELNDFIRKYQTTLRVSNFHSGNVIRIIRVPTFQRQKSTRQHAKTTYESTVTTTSRKRDNLRVVFFLTMFSCLLREQ